MLSIVLLVAANAPAHHSLAPYDLSQVTTISGTVARFDFINPHGSIFLDVILENGIAEHWMVILESSSQLRRLGWSKNTLIAGETIKVKGNRALDGSFRLRAAFVEVQRSGKALTLPAFTQ